MNLVMRLGVFVFISFLSFQIGAGLYAVGRPVQKRNDEDGQIGTIQSLPLERGALFTVTVTKVIVIIMSLSMSASWCNGKVQLPQKLLQKM